MLSQFITKLTTWIISSSSSSSSKISTKVTRSPSISCRGLNSVSARLLPKEEADSIQFSSHQLNHLLELHSFPRGSPQATTMEDTLRQCKTKPIEGVIKTCSSPTTWASMLDFAKRILGPDRSKRSLRSRRMHFRRWDFRVSLTGENGDRVEAVAVCHIDTSQWSKNHVSIKVLGINPGGSSPVCHFFPTDNLVCAPSSVV